MGLKPADRHMDGRSELQKLPRLLLWTTCPYNSISEAADRLKCTQYSKMREKQNRNITQGKKAREEVKCSRLWDLKRDLLNCRFMGAMYI